MTPPPTPDRAAADREAFEAYVRARGWPVQSVPLSAQDAYLAGAGHGRAEAERETAHTIQGGNAEIRRLRAELARERELVRSFQDGYHAIAAALGTTVPETSDEDIVDRIERLRADLARVEGERDAARKAVCVAAAPSEAKSCAYCGNENIGVEVRTQDYPGMTGFSVVCGSAFCGARGPVRRAQMDAVEEWNKVHDWYATPAPRPDEAEALRMRVVEAAMAYTGEYATPLNGPIRSALFDSCDALRAHLLRASSPAPSPVEAAAGRLRAVLDRSSGRIWLDGDYHADLRAVLDALGAKGAT